MTPGTDNPAEDTALMTICVTASRTVPYNNSCIRMPGHVTHMA